MVESSDPNLDRVFHALSDPTRRGMVAALYNGSRTVTELAAPFAGTMSLAGASKHIKVLEGASILRRSIEGRVHVCSLNVAALQAIESWMEPYARFWQERLDALDDLVGADGDLP